VDLLAEEVGLEAQKDFGTFYFAQVEALRSNLFRVGHHGVDERPHKVPESLRNADDFVQDGFLFGLKW